MAATKRKGTKSAARKRPPRKSGAATAPSKSSLDARTAVELEAAVFRRLLEHFDERKDVQNIELMTLAGFCRNCLSRWFVEAATERGIAVDLDAARERVYGMPYDEWKSKHQPAATDDQLRRFEAAQRRAKE